jgi:hydroxymethylpyrimidine pyrophosphatase-like HAD family hydrolase
MALTKLMQWYNVNPEQTMAIGDSNNDLTAFKTAGASVAIKSRSSALLAQATHKINFKKDAVAHAIDSYVISSKKGDITLIASDLDGTLLQSSTKDIVESTKLSIQKAVDEKGMIFVISTGRAVDDCLVVLKNLEIKDQSKLYVIGVNGGCIYHVAKRKIIYINYLPSPLASQVYGNFLRIANDVNRKGEMSCQLFALGDAKLNHPQPLY